MFPLKVFLKQGRLRSSLINDNDETFKISRQRNLDESMAQDSVLPAWWISLGQAPAFVQRLVETQNSWFTFTKLQRRVSNRFLLQCWPRTIEQDWRSRCQNDTAAARISYYSIHFLDAYMELSCVASYVSIQTSSVTSSTYSTDCLNPIHWPPPSGFEDVTNILRHETVVDIHCRVGILYHSQSNSLCKVSACRRWPHNRLSEYVPWECWLGPCQLRLLHQVFGSPSYKSCSIWQIKCSVWRIYGGLQPL